MLTRTLCTLLLLVPSMGCFAAAYYCYRDAGTLAFLLAVVGVLALNLPSQTLRGPTEAKPEADRE